MTETMTRDAATAVAPVLDALQAALDKVFASELTLHDRCDKCGAAAKAQVLVNPDLPVLLLCGHDFRASRATFLARGYEYRIVAGEDESTYTLSSGPTNNKARDAGSV